MYRLLKKIMFQFQPETAHNIVEANLKYIGNFAPMLLSLPAKRFFTLDRRLSQELFGTTFAHPVGLAAGFDKNATMLKGLMAMGFGHIEFGTITPKAQEGNVKPRLFRFPEEESIQNAMGFNNEGLEKVKSRLKKHYPFAVPLGANIGKNKNTPENGAIEDYRTLISGFSGLCDYMVINISSPNTPGLRDLQNETFVKELFSMASSLTKTPVLLKVSPDISIDDAIKICEVAISNGASGIIATNTTIDYSLLQNSKDFGGISGKVLKEKSALFFRSLARHFYGKTILISVGGIDSAQEAYARILEGANLVQLYSAFIFQGPSLNRCINEEILSLMERDGFHNISEAIGAKR